MGVRRAVFQHHAHAGGFVAAGLLELAIGQRGAQLHHIGRRLGEVDIHRVDLLNHRQRRRFALADQRTLRHQRPANAARNWRLHAGVIQVDARGLQRRFADGHIGLRLLVAGYGVGVFLLADGVGGHQRRIALGQRSRLRQIGFRAGQRSLSALQCGGVGRRVNHKQRLAGFDITALAKHPLLHNARCPSAHLRYAGCFKATGQLGQ